MDWISALQALVKPTVVLVYTLFGVLLLLAATGRRMRIPIHLPAIKVLVGCAAGLIWIWFAIHGPVYIFSVSLAIVVFAVQGGAWRSRGLLFGGAAVVILSSSLAWWITDGPRPTGWWQPLAFAAAVWGIQAGFLQSPKRPNRNWLPLAFFLFAAAGFALMANVTQYETGSLSLALLVHHQGAYIGPALHIKAGLVPFYDIPLQYGLGPTLSIAAVCGATNCWSGMAFLMITSTLIMGLLILRMALATGVPRGNVWRATTTTLVVFAGVFLWPGFRLFGKHSAEAPAPSVGGLRFFASYVVSLPVILPKNHGSRGGAWHHRVLVVTGSLGNVAGGVWRTRNGQAGIPQSGDAGTGHHCRKLWSLCDRPSCDLRCMGAAGRDRRIHSACPGTTPHQSLQRLRSPVGSAWTGGVECFPPAVRRTSIPARSRDNLSPVCSLQLLSRPQSPE